jgi:CRISP-associated protein Cas1
MARQRCDPFDIAAVRAAIDRGEQSERAAYLAYASTAARPYARSTFSVMVRAKQRVPKAASLPNIAAPDHHWREREPVKPRILSLLPGGGLRVQAGSLIAFDRERSLVYSRSAKPPMAIVLSSAGGFVSIEAVRFCVRAGVTIVALNRAHGFLSILSSGGQAHAKLLRAQVQSEPTRIARAIVAAKIASMGRAGALPHNSAERFVHSLTSDHSLDDIRNVEAQASRVAWAATPPLQWRAGPVPVDLRAPWLMRARLDARAKRNARHPVNAMLNAVFAVTAGRLAAYIVAAGLSPAIGFLHADKRGRWSLAWDAIEPLRPMIEAAVFAFIVRERFAPSDFVRERDGSLRLAPGLLSAVLKHCSPKPVALARTVRRLTGLMAAGGEVASPPSNARVIPAHDPRATIERQRA